jgi:RNA polymerase sigma factor (TIGR02999 family)
VPGEITRLLAEARNGDRDAQSRLAEAVYHELYGIAARHMRNERPGHTLQPSILVHEAFMGLVAQENLSWQNRTHFFAVAAQYMRRLLVDHARSRNAEKRGGGRVNIQLDDVFVFSDAKCEEVIAVDQALARLSEVDPRQCRIVELRFFAGLTEEEIAEVLGISARSVKREWRVAKAWLRAEFSSAETDDKNKRAVASDQGNNG